jgi:hypothetical protein
LSQAKSLICLAQCAATAKFGQSDAIGLNQAYTDGMEAE